MLKARAIAILVSSLALSACETKAIYMDSVNKFKLTLKQNDLIFNIRNDGIFIHSMSINDLNIHKTLISQQINTYPSTIIIKDFKKYRLQESKPYFFLIFQDDARYPNKRIDGVNFCFKGTNVLLDTAEVKLTTFSQLCQKL